MGPGNSLLPEPDNDQPGTSADPTDDDNKVKLRRQKFIKPNWEAHDKGVVFTQGLERLYAPPNYERREHGRQLARKKQGAGIGRKSLDNVWEMLPANTKIVKQTPDTTTLRIVKTKPFLFHSHLSVL